MLIVKKNSYGDAAPYIALCGELRRTKKRVYVRFVKGTRSAINDPFGTAYVDIDHILTFDATEAQFDAMETASTAYEVRRSEIDQELTRLRQQFDDDLCAMAVREG